MNNTARAKGTITYTTEREIKWIGILVNLVDDGTNPPVFDKNSCIAGIDESVGPGLVMRIQQDIVGSGSLEDDDTPQMPKSTLGAYPTVAYEEKGMGLYYFGARYYDPEVGVWGSVDPLSQDFNVYGYCAGNPVMLVDPNGESWAGALAIAGALIGGYASGAFSSGSLNPGDWEEEDWIAAGMGAFQWGVRGYQHGTMIDNRPVDVFQIDPEKMNMDDLLEKVSKLDPGKKGKDVEFLASVEEDKLKRHEEWLRKAWKKMSDKMKKAGLNPREPNFKASREQFLVSYTTNKNRAVFWWTHGGGGAVTLNDGSIYARDLRGLKRGESLKAMVLLSCRNGNSLDLWHYYVGSDLLIAAFKGDFDDVQMKNWMFGKHPSRIGNGFVTKVGLNDVLKAIE